MTTNLLVSALAGRSIGTGHLRRMITLGEALTRHPGIRLQIHTSPLGLDILARSTLAGRAVALPAPETPEATAADLTARLPGIRPDILILDNYFWNAATEAPLQPHCGRLCVVDDLANRPHLADLLLDQNANHRPADYADLVPESCLLAVGSPFCLISAPFQRLREAGFVSAEARAARNRVFVSLGGGDPKRDLPRILKVILEGTDLEVSLATGSHVADASTLRALASRHAGRVELVFDSPRVAEQMNEAGFAVSAGGTMTWERAVLGLPTLCLVLADNQIETARWMETRSLHRSFDMRGTWSEAKLLTTIRAYAADHSARIAHAQASSRLIDGKGAETAARAILDGHLSVTSAHRY
ncbi:UDP-2,4-diacetamido-2,4,6-trideoxy-beta-L-altropyranose hydrolase [Paracoccus denitrificans]|uniref:UDP-2,4-diacetamido-2,4, 6-trideoxy-beta-L-altropyranose hydrolase n=1 Tax=Paracoccus denitrificans TaxID=266 RepID=UPI003364B8DB